MRYQTISIAAVLLVLAGCGSSNDGSGSSTSVPQGDSFVSATAQLAATAPEDSEASDIEALVETMPEDAEPENVG
jgi:hypothetical protein